MAKNSKVIRIPIDDLEIAHKAAMSATGKQVTDAQAVLYCIRSQSNEAMGRLAESVNTRNQAVVIANTLAAIESLTGEKCEVRMARDGRWWIAHPGASEGFPLGKVNPAALATELARLGRELEPHDTTH